MLGEWLYLEFLIPIKDYATTLKPKEFVFEWIAPAALSTLVYFNFIKDIAYTNEVGQFTGYVLSTLGVLFGFSIASITLLVTSDSENIRKLKSTLTDDRTIDRRRISVYRLTLITFTFLLHWELLSLFLNFFYILVSSLSEEFRDSHWEIFYGVDFFLILQVIALNIRNTTNMYFVFTRQSTSN